MIEYLQAESLALRRRTEVGFKTVRVDDWDERLDRVQRRTGLRDILGDMTTAPSEYGVHCRDAVRRCLHLDIIDGLH